MSVPNQRFMRFNRYDPKDSGGYTPISNDYTLNILYDLDSMGAVKLYFYLLTQIPDLINGQPNKKNIRKLPFEFSTKDAREKIKADTKTIELGFKKLIEVGILTNVKGNLWIFDSVPLKYRVKTEKEYQEILEDVPAEEAYKQIHTQQLQEEKQNMDILIKQFRQQYSWEDDETYLANKKEWENNSTL